MQSENEERDALSDEAAQQARAELEALRQEIDGLDGDLVQILARRADSVRRVGSLKGQFGSLSHLDEDRERRLMERWSARAQAAGLSDHLAGRVLREILEHSRRSQEGSLVERAQEAQERTLKVVYQGVPWAYSDLATAKLFGTRHEGPVERVGLRTFGEAAASVRSGQADYALLPVENSIAGGIADVGRILAETDLVVVDEEVWEVKHILAGLPGTRVEDLCSVRSHPAALAQCGTFLRRLEGASADPWFDTAGAAASIAEEGRRDQAALCSEEAALAHGLEVLEREVADDASNVTRFLLLAREAEPPALNVVAKTSLFVLLDHQQGSLSAFLSDLSEASLNLTRIESRPQPRTPWQYLFFVDIEGHAADPRVAQALQRARRHCNLLRVLGTYPMRTKRPAHLDEARPAVALEPAPASADAPRRILAVGPLELGSKRFVVGCSAGADPTGDLDPARAAGARLFHGGSFSTRPDNEPGCLDAAAMVRLGQHGRGLDLPLILSVRRAADVEVVAEVADLLYIAGIDLQQKGLLQAAGHSGRPVLLERAPGSDLQAWQAAAEIVQGQGNHQIVLCERAEGSSLDLGLLAELKKNYPYPLLVALPALGISQVAMAKAAAAAGVDGLLCGAPPQAGSSETHWSSVQNLVRELLPLLEAQGRSL